MYQTISLFPTPVYVTSIGNLSSEELNKIDSFEFRETSIADLVSSNTKIIDELPQLKSKIEFHLKSYIDNILCPATDISLRFTQSWINKIGNVKQHLIHTHPNSIISGVYYIFPETPSSIIFYKSSKTDLIELDLFSNNEFNSKEFKVNVTSGMLIMFPSHLAHSVEINQSETPRISLAFNTFYTGTVGNAIDLTEMELT